MPRSSGSVKIRQAARGDLDIIRKLEKSIFSDPWTSTEILRVLTSKKSRVFIAVHADKPVGLVVFHLRGDYIALASIGVLPDYRRLGIGTQLIDVVLRHATDSEKRIRAYVREDLLPAQVFLRAAGFKAVSITQDGSDKHVDLYVMEYRFGRSGTVALPRHRLREYFANREEKKSTK